MRYRLRLALAMSAFLWVGIGYVGAVSFNWSGPTTVSNETVYADREGNPKISNQLTVSGDITIDGDVVISNTQQMTASDDYFQVVVSGDSFIHPSSGSPSGRGELIFYNDTCCQTIVFVDNDLIFTGSNIADRYIGNRELTLTFSGQGQTIFHIGNKKQVGFEGFFGDGSGAGWNSYWDDYTQTGSGVMVYVTMDQTYAQAIEQGRNKVVFERNYTFDDSLFDPMLSSTQDSVKVTIGKNSFLTYISDVETGLLNRCDIGDARGYGTVAFDPSCYGRGRMILHLKGSSYVDETGRQIGIDNGYNDAALVVAGHYVSDYTTTDGILNGVRLNRPAGVEAILRVIDERAWADTQYYRNSESSNLYVNEITGEPILNDGPYTGKPSRRGLLVVNECKSLPTFATDPYVNNEWASEYIFLVAQKGSTPIRPGFIFGINGSMEVFHNTFFDYVAASTMRVNPFEFDWTGSAIPGTRKKTHNPSALFTDGLGIFNLTNFDPANPFKPENALFYPYDADVASLGGRHANILLRGDARLYLRSGVMNDGYVADVDWYTTPSSLGGYLAGIDRVYSFTINSDALEGSYDGSFLTGYGTGGELFYETTGEGNNVLDVEGKLSIRSTDDKNSTNDAGFVICQPNREVDPLASNCTYQVRHPVTTSAARGVLNLPPVKIDVMGREVLDDMLTMAFRPFTVNQVYPAYNSSSIQLNADLELHNVQWHHNDLLKIATPEPDKSHPAVVGGEKAAFDYYYWSTLPALGMTETANTLFVENPIEQINTKVPLISLFNTKIHLHESLVASGVRFVVTDKFYYDPTDSLGHPKLVPNVSTLMCYNHGDSLDMLKRGYGRTFLLGSQQNKMADGIMCENYLKNAYLNVYRSWNTDGNATIWGDGNYLVQFDLETDAQPRAIAQYETRLTNPSGSDAFSKLLEWGIDPFKRSATQVFYLGNASYSSLGWTTTMGDQVISLYDMRNRTYATDGSYSYSFGINEGLRPRPWDAEWGFGNYSRLDSTVISHEDFRFSLSSDANDRAEMYINGDDYYFGGRDSSGNVATEGVVAANESCIFYTNFGGKTYINQKTVSVDQGDYFDCFVDTIFAYRQWPRIQKDQTNPLSPFIDGLSGLIDLPHDQVKFGRSIQPYGLDFTNMLLAGDGQVKENNVRLSVYDDNQYGITPVQKSKASGEEVTINWNFRTDKSTRIGTLETTPTFTPVKSPMFGSDIALGDDSKADAFRSIIDPRSTIPAYVAGSATMPDAVLTVSTGDVITQMRVSGATKADPFHLYVSGGPNGYGSVREFTSLTSNYFNPGEGSHAAIMLDGGGHIGLGSRHWNEHSAKAWNILGYDYVTLYPNGQSFVWVNSDLIVADRLAIIPTKNFGAVGVNQSLTYDDIDQRITFYSDVPREIRIPEGGELDLSAFGFPEGTLVSEFPQQIVFDGKVKLIFEPGAKLRFPSGVPRVVPVLYMNGESELIFEGVDDRDRAELSTLADSSDIRSRILGVGQIWLNKKAKMTVNDNALVGVETDSETPNTQITLSINRQARLYIGDNNVSGGVLQVGNTTPSEGSTIDFTISLISREAGAEIRREGFLGLGVGVIRKSTETMNGTLTGKCWKVQGLYDVRDVALNIQSGTFDHNQIYNGSDSRASLMAIGPISGQYTVVLGTRSEATIKGGGNLLYVAAAGDIYPGGTGFSTTLIGDTASILGGTTGDYNIIAPDRIIRQIETGASIAGTGTVVKNSSFTGDLQAFYNYLRMPALDTVYPATFPTTPTLIAGQALMPSQYVAFGQTELDLRRGYILLGTTILRDTITELTDGSNPEDSLRFGAAKSSSRQDKTELNTTTRSF